MIVLNISGAEGGIFPRLNSNRCKTRLTDKKAPNPMQDEVDPPFDEIEIGVNPHAEAEGLFDEFCIELDPDRDRTFLERLGKFEPGQWIMLEELCQTLTKLPDHAAEINARIPGRLARCHIPWLGRQTDKSQPDSVILGGDAVTMYHRAMLMSLAAQNSPSDAESKKPHDNRFIFSLR
jgi:hypothetical protein